MSLNGKRAEIAAMLSTVPDVHGHDRRPAVPDTGDAWPVLGPMDRGPGDGFIVTWLVRVFMPQDEVAASDWWDLHWPGIFYALKPAGFIDRAVPVALGQDQLAFEITMRAEE